MDREKFAEFLELPEHERLEYLVGVKLTRWQRFKIRVLNKWWSSWRDANPHLRAIDLWESIRKGRY